jgi:hypothetical protein
MRFPSQDLGPQYISQSYQDVLQHYITGGFLYVLDGYGNVVFTVNSSSIGDTVITSNMTSSMTVASASISNIYQVHQVSSSFASSSVSASYALTSSISLYSNAADSASYAISSIFSDTASLAIYSDFSGTASLAMETISASYALTSSYALNSGGTTIITGSLYPITSSWSNYSSTASYFSGSVIGSVPSSSYAVSASWAPSSDGSISSSYALTASYALNGGTGGTSLITASLYPITSSWSNYSLTTSYFSGSIIGSVPSSSYALTASYALNGGTGGTSLVTGSLYPITSSWTFNALTASYVLAPLPSGSIESASYALTASYALNGGSSGLNVPSYDYSTLEYNGPYGQFSKCTYKIGGISGSIVCIVDAYYSASIFMGVSKSLG